MPFYLVQGSYSMESTAAMVKKPTDRAATVRAIVEKFGVKMHAFYFCFGEYDVVIILEAPDNATMAATSMAVGASGAIRSFKTTVLMPPDESLEAMQKAGEISAAYRPPGK